MIDRVFRDDGSARSERFAKFRPTISILPRRCDQNVELERHMQRKEQYRWPQHPRAGPTPSPPQRLSRGQINKISKIMQDYN